MLTLQLLGSPRPPDQGWSVIVQISYQLMMSSSLCIKGLQRLLVLEQKCKTKLNIQKPKVSVNFNLIFILFN